MLVSIMCERFVMVGQSCLEIGGATDILLDLDLPVHRRLGHLCQVNHIGVQALALQGALASQPLCLGAVARPRLLLLWDWRLAVGQHLPVVGRDDLLHIGAGRVGDLQVAPVEDLYIYI